MEVHIFDDKNILARRFCDKIAMLISETNEFHIALSGGSTPRVIFKTLAEEYQNKIDWKKLRIYWGDERCVPPNNEINNYFVAKQTFLDKVGIADDHIYRIRGEADPDKEAMRYAEVLANKLPVKDNTPCFDLIMLGLGEDGHTASIFPHEVHLWGAQSYCAVATHPDSGQKRISLTGKIINNAKEVYFLVTGASKSQIVKELLGTSIDSPDYPATLVQPSSGKLTWYLDKQAASLL